MEFLKTHAGELIVGLFGAISTFWGYWSGKKRNNAEVKTVEANAIEAMQRAYDMYVEHNNRKMADMEQELAQMKARIAEVEDHWRRKLERVERKWQNKYAGLEKEFEEYKRAKS